MKNTIIIRIYLEKYRLTCSHYQVYNKPFFRPMFLNTHTIKDTHP
jgi:hypothetical protein